MPDLTPVSYVVLGLVERATHPGDGAGGEADGSADVDGADVDDADGASGATPRCVEGVTPYAMKQAVAVSIGNYWSFPHSQLYAEPARLAAEGLLVERQEAGGRRRKTYTITDAGRAALHAWLAEPATDDVEVRDVGLLKLHFLAARGESAGDVAASRLVVHHRKREEYARIRAELEAHGADSARVAATLRMGELYEEAAIRFWEEIRSGRVG